MKRVTAILIAMLLLVGLLAGCQGAPAAAKEDAVVVLESGSTAEIQVKKDTLAQDIDAAIVAMLQASALTAEENTVLATVKSGDAALAETVLKLITESFTKAEFSGAALCQLGEDPAQGKAQLINALVAANNTYTAEELNTLSVNTLNLLCQSEEIAGLLSEGKASQAALVGEDVAIEVSLYYVKTDRDAVEDLKVAVAYNDGLVYYDVRYTMAGTEQEAYVDAVTGEVLYSGVVGGEQHELQEDAPFTEENAIAAACVSCGVDVAAAKNVSCKFVDHANPPYFEVKFTYEDQEFSVLIAATTGMVLESEAPETTDPAFDNSADNTPVEDYSPDATEDSFVAEDGGAGEDIPG